MVGLLPVGSVGGAGRLLSVFLWVVHSWKETPGKEGLFFSFLRSAVWRPVFCEKPLVLGPLCVGPLGPLRRGP